MSEQVVYLLTEASTNFYETNTELTLSKAHEMQLAKLLNEAYQELDAINTIHG
jgi:hypothetical protein